MSESLSQYPKLKERWHPTKNGSICLEQIRLGSQLVVWWKCEQGHEFQEIVRTVARRKKFKCPLCDNISGNGDLLASRPDVSSMWHSGKNGELRPHQVTAFSHKRVWWICEFGHEFQAVVGNMSRAKQNGCPVCWNETGRTKAFIGTKGSLQKNYPEIAAEWHKEKNGALSPSDVTSRTSRKIWWECVNGHEWKTPVSARTNGHGCPECSRIKNKNAITKWAVKKKGSLSDTHHHLVSEWHPTKNGQLKPDEISAGSSKKVWWLCKKGHEWKTHVKVRSNDHGCPDCKTKSSRLEIRLLCEFRGLFGEVEWRHKIDGVECDLLISNINCVIEVDGEYWHKDKLEKDRKKNQILTGKGLTVIRLRGGGLPHIGIHDVSYQESEDHLNLIQRLLRKLMVVNLDLKSGLLSKIEEYESAGKYINDKEYRTILSLLPSPEPKNSLEAKYPSLTKDWSPKNAPLRPVMFAPKSHKKVWWKCPKGHDDYLSAIAKKTDGRGCPKCGVKKRAAARIIKAIERTGSLVDNFPDVAAEFHPRRNGELKPSVISSGSKKRVWWMCKEGHEWQAVICNRTRKRHPSGCPECFKPSKL